MITSIQSYARQCRQSFRQWLLRPGIHTALRILQYLLAGLVLSAASLGQYAQPLALGLVCTAAGWPAVLMALGGSLGYWLFWGTAGLQGPLWLAAGLAAALLLGRRLTPRAMPLLLPAIAAVITAAAGLAFQIRLSDPTPLAVYLLRILIAGGVTWLFQEAEQNRSRTVTDLVWAVWVLALAQIAPARWLCLGFAAAGALSSAGTFSAAALAGLALDFAQVTPVPMTAVTCLACFLRQIPGVRKRVAFVFPTAVYLLTLGLCGQWDLMPVAPLVLGGFLGRFLPNTEVQTHRRGEIGVAQVRLEMASTVFSQMQGLLLESISPPIDEEALILRAADRACSSCPCRKTCKEQTSAARLSPQLLHRPLPEIQDLGISCRKEHRLVQELRHAQEQLRTLRAAREQQSEYRQALLQQYQFLAEYAQDLSDELGKRVRSAVPRYKPQISLCANHRESDNGDRCQHFQGPGCRYYVVLCDGMGTGIGAMHEGNIATTLLKKLLLAGFPGEYALRSLNSLCALRGSAGAVTVDLAELQLDTGKVLLYKWGAAGSYLLSRAGAEKIGTAGPPPGLFVASARETVERLSLRRGETLVLCSDGLDGEEVLRCCLDPEEPVGELAARILRSGALHSADDATVAVARLVPGP